MLQNLMSHRFKSNHCFKAHFRDRHCGTKKVMKDLDEHKKIQILNSIGIVPPIVIVLIIKPLILNIVIYSFVC